ncbi:hypothetical protein CWI38_0996p0020 [Hamiltosporidium tvaerminnensis]|uniref:Uncharacterized protein n=1 Tax=Hamiltosporidium tvaerminnensis TaxID=1176355 RepID=A0A4Q9LTP9_9MICR|nr:hypothetical protein CWI38_0996p0020 [Hamiltosporidium tvaerminnensis]
MNILLVTVNIILCTQSLDRIYEEIEPKTLDDVYDSVKNLCGDLMQRIGKLKCESLKKICVLQCADTIGSYIVNDLISSFVEENEHKLNVVRVGLKSSGLTAEKRHSISDEIAKMIFKWQRNSIKKIPAVQNLDVLENIDFFESENRHKMQKVESLSKFISKDTFHDASDDFSCMDMRKCTYFIVFAGMLRRMEIFALREIINFMAKRTIFADKKVFIFINDSLQKSVENHFKTFSETPVFLDTFYSFETIQLNSFSAHRCPLVSNEDAFVKRDVYIIGLDQLKIHEDVLKANQDKKEISIRKINSRNEIFKNIIFKYELKWLTKISLINLSNNSTLLFFYVYTSLQRGFTVKIICENVQPDSKKIFINFFDSINDINNRLLFVLGNSNYEITQINEKDRFEGQVIFRDFRKRIEQYISNALMSV